ncbi:MAG: prepilin-type N-terminal cleavage/methylation domain-containing protein [Ruminococcus sp.]|nr:prepilin-type N-terminal cleavage/methylation domain-containing protein [Ruminococcus sp.]
MKRKFKKKVFKGMTLIEIIIAIAVLAVMTSVLVIVSQSIQRYLRASEDINDRVAVQAPVAYAGNGGTPEGEVEIIVYPKNGDTKATIPLKGNMFSVYDDAEMSGHEKEAGGKLNMKYISNIKTTTVAPGAKPNGTTATTTEASTQDVNTEEGE